MCIDISDRYTSSWLNTLVFIILVPKINMVTLKSKIPVQWDLDCAYSTVCGIFFVMINFHELAINLIIPN